jgi:hypothetical protein
VNRKKEKRRFTRRETLALHYGVCCMCKGNLYGFHCQCLSCTLEFLCRSCHQSFRQSPEHEQGKVHEHSNFRAIRPMSRWGRHGWCCIASTAPL